jgi:hypothetical protein
MIFEISFSIPKDKIFTTHYDKTKILSELIPGKTETYIYNTEEDYYCEYKKSYFALTKQQGGWDCMRHYEIIANGCLPYFINIENCPKNKISLLPKELFLESNNLYDNKFKNKNINQLIEEDINEYNNLRSKLLEYMQKYLTTDKMAQYILQKTNFENISKVLYLSGDTNPDYLRCVTLHGFKTLFGSNCHDYPKIPHIYKSNNIEYKNLYGKGYSYTNLLEPELRNDKLDDTLIEDIKKKYYDIIIFGSFHRGMPYYDLISEIYKSSEIILLCGEDIHYCNNHNYLEKGHSIFVRECY